MLIVITSQIYDLYRFQKLKFKHLRIDRKYLELTGLFQKEIEDVRDRYNEDRSDPPIPRNVPPIAGRILWIRQLFRRIESPMEIYKECRRVISHDHMQRCIKIYNALISVFIHYEMIYHKSWYDSSEIVSIIVVYYKMNKIMIKLLNVSIDRFDWHWLRP